MSQRHAGATCLAIVTALQASAGPLQAQIEGRVVDNFGKPVPGMLVTIRGLRFEARTDDRGRYKLEYVPGVLELIPHEDSVYRRPFGASFSLTLATSGKVPVEDLIMVRVLPGRGAYAEGKDNYTPLTAEKVVETRKQKTMGGEVRWSVAGSAAALTAGPIAGKTRIYAGRLPRNDVASFSLRVFRLSPEGVFATATTGMTGLVESIQATQVEGVFVSATDSIDMLIVSPPDGRYAVCEWVEGLAAMSMSGRPGRVCYPIVVGTQEAQLSDANPIRAPADNERSGSPVAAGGTPVPSQPTATGQRDPLTLSAPVGTAAAVLERYGEVLPAREQFPEIQGSHTGIDYLGPGNVLAVASGAVALVVLKSAAKDQKDHGFGNTVILEHRLTGGQTVYSLYAHLATLDPKVVSGAQIAGGEVIGTMGQSGDGKDDFWALEAGAHRCAPRKLYFAGLQDCVRVHFELKTKPVLENPTGGKACRRSTVLGSKASECYGYTPKSPESYGYLDPGSLVSTGRVVAPPDSVAPRN